MVKENDSKVTCFDWNTTDIETDFIFTENIQHRSLVTNLNSAGYGIEKYFLMNNVKIAVIWALTVETVLVFPHRGSLIYICSIAHVTQPDLQTRLTVCFWFVAFTYQCFTFVNLSVCLFAPHENYWSDLMKILP